MVIRNFLIVGFCIVFCFAGVLRSEPTTKYEPAYSTITLRGAFEAYPLGHNGQLPNDWNDLRELIEIDNVNKEIQATQGRSIYELYAFVKSDVPLMEGYEGDRVVMVRTAPFQLHGINRVGRYVITLGKDGKARSGFIDEDKIKASFAAAEAPLPSLESSTSAQQSSEPSKVQTPSTTETISITKYPTPPGEQAQASSAKLSSEFLILATVALAGLLAGAFVLFRRRKFLARRK